MKTLKFITILSIFLSGLMASNAYSQRDRDSNRRLVIDMHDQEFRQNGVIALKREIQNQYPRINLQRVQLDSVRLVAKSRRGRGTANLVVGRDQTRAANVYGNPRDFNDPSPRTFDRIDFRNPSYGSNGKWQIKLRGNIIVRKVVVKISRGGNGGGGSGVENIRCESEGFRYTECLVRGTVVNARITRQLSDSACIQGRTWGVTRQTIWVDRGCRAIFRVETRGSGPRRPRR